MQRWAACHRRSGARPRSSLVAPAAACLRHSRREHKRAQDSRHPIFHGYRPWRRRCQRASANRARASAADQRAADGSARKRMHRPPLSARLRRRTAPECSRSGVAHRPVGSAASPRAIGCPARAAENAAIAAASAAWATLQPIGERARKGEKATEQAPKQATSVHRRRAGQGGRVQAAADLRADRRPTGRQFAPAPAERGQPPPRFGHYRVRAPVDAGEQVCVEMPEPDQHIAAVLRRCDDGIVFTQRSARQVQVARVEGRAIRADQNGRSAIDCVHHCLGHARAEIGALLPEQRDTKVAGALGEERMLGARRAPQFHIA